MMKRFVTVLLIGLSVQGCALTTAAIDIPYQPLGGAAPAAAVPGASAAAVSVTTTDARTTYRDRVSTKKNGYGMEMAAITASNDIPTSVNDAIKQELTARGIGTAGGPGKVDVQLVRFYNDFKTGVFSGDAIAQVAFNVKVTASDKPFTFTKYYEGNGKEPNIQLMNGSNAQAALIKAFGDAVSSAVNDPDFIKAVITAGTPAGKPAS